MKFPSVRLRKEKTQMNKIDLFIEVSELLIEVVKDLRKLADSVSAVSNAVTEGLTAINESNPQIESSKQLPIIPLEKVRAVLAEKSQDGFTADVREILAKHGAAKLSEVNPSEYEAILKEAEVLGNE